MKRILIAGLRTKALATVSCLVLSVSLVQAQQKEGKVVYERTSQMQARFNINGEDQVVPQTRKDNFEVIFGNNQSLWKASEKDEDDAHSFSNEGGAQIRMIVADNNDVLFTNFETGKRTEKREFLDKTFIIDDSVRSLKWKMTGETKTILDKPCMKAVATNITTRTTMTMDDGKMERKEVQDTSTIIAWFTSNIPVSAGPAEYQGQLPGLILEMDIANGRQKFVATSISEKADLTVIKEPTGKKHYTAEEFRKERDKMMAEMQQNNQGGHRQIRIN
jgi:GLPGLI family protein